MALREDSSPRELGPVEHPPSNWRFQRVWGFFQRFVPYSAAREGQIRQLTDELAEERAHDESLAEQLNEANEELKFAYSVAADRVRQVRQLTKERAEERAQRDSLADQLDEAYDKLNIASKKRKILRVELDDEREESAQARAMLDKANEELETAKDTIESVRAELGKQRDNCGKLTAERDAERKKSADFENQLKLLRDKASPHAVMKGCACLFSPSHDYDFRKVSGADKPFVRGGVPYIRPAGSMRYALEVANRYDDKDWLKDDAGGWAVAYHGTTRENAVSIAQNGFHVGKGMRFQYGTGIYCTPDPGTAKPFASDFIENGKTCRVILQVRVKPGRYRVVRPGNGLQKEYWLVADPADIRPYGLCVYGL